jgi:hypothetical protein
MRHGWRRLTADLMVVTVAAYLQAMVFVRCAASALTPAASSPESRPERDENAARARQRGTIQVRPNALEQPRCPGTCSGALYTPPQPSGPPALATNGLRDRLLASPHRLLDGASVMPGGGVEREGEQIEIEARLK